MSPLTFPHLPPNSVRQGANQKQAWQAHREAQGETAETALTTLAMAELVAQEAQEEMVEAEDAAARGHVEDMEPREW